LATPQSLQKRRTIKSAGAAGNRLSAKRLRRSGAEAICCRFGGV
jgi:hypothetical protein